MSNHTQEVTSADDQLKVMDQMINDGILPKFPKPGEIVEGKILSISRFEVKIDLEGLTTGVVRGKEVEDFVAESDDIKVGDKVSATVLGLENENGEMELSFSQAGHKKAWEGLESMARESQIIEAKITAANKGGLMTKVGKVMGFIPVSQLSPEHYPRVEGGDKNKILEKLNKLVGTALSVKVIDVSEKEEKLILSEKAAWEEKQKSTLASYKIGDVVEGTVTGHVDFGVFVEFGEGLEGLVHISELAWQRIDRPSDIVKIGDKVKAQIISIEGSKISLSMKKLQEDPWKQAAAKYKIGQVVPGKVLKVTPFGLFVELDTEIHGLAHVSELSDKPVTSVEDTAKIGETLDFKIISIESQNHRLGLTRKGLDESEMTSDPSAAKKKE